MKIPGRGSVAVPGTVGVAPGRGEIIIPPVSVCHQVSTIGQRPLPITLWYQIHASGLIGSPTVPGTATLPLPGIFIDVVDREGHSVGVNEGGYLVIRKPWPGMLRTIWGDDERFRAQYWSDIPGVYFAGAQAATFPISAAHLIAGVHSRGKRVLDA